MAYYKICVESVGGGINSYITECRREDIALEEAYNEAVADYESFEGSHGIISYDDVLDNKEEFNLDEDASEEECWDVYIELRDNELSYWVKELSIKTWEEAAKYCEDTYGSFINWEEEFFVCPECDEPILKEDWEEHNFTICPVCEFDFFNED